MSLYFLKQQAIKFIQWLRWIPSTDVECGSEEATSHQTLPMTNGGPSTEYAQRASEEAPSPPTQHMDEADPSNGSSEGVPQSDGRTQVGQRFTQQSMTEEENMKQRRFNITICTTAIAAASLIGFAAASLESKITIPRHNHVLLALLGLSLMSMCVSFACGMLMLILWAALRDTSPNMTVLSKILTMGSIVSTALGVFSGVAFGIQKMFEHKVK